MKRSSQRPVILAIMDGVGVRAETFGNAVALAKTPNLDKLSDQALYREIFAHGTYVGMPSNADLGNSEVGHNAMGAGRVFDQGAKLVQSALDSGAVLKGQTWKSLISQCKNSTLHFIGLLSDGNVHSHEQHLYSLLKAAKAAGIKRVRIHPLLDGRDVGETTAGIYAARLSEVMSTLRSPQFDIAVASGGGRMVVTMDRYEADWRIVERGWQAHVHGIADEYFTSLDEAIASFRSRDITDQYCPAFVIKDKNGAPTGKIENGDGVVLFNFRGDRAIEISRAFCESRESFNYFYRGAVPKVYFAGMMQYDGDLKIPQNYLVDPPIIEDTLGEYLASQEIRQLACSETQKYGHVTFFWNGNRSGKFNPTTENYVEIPSDRIEFDQKPAMKAAEITSILISELDKSSFDFARLNLANGDMVGHTGNLKAAISAMETVDREIGRLIEACKKMNALLVVTADHGNCDEMFDAKAKDFPDWTLESLPQPKAKTSHTTNPVPFYMYDPNGKKQWTLATSLPDAGLANIANTVLVLLGMKPRDIYAPSLINER